MLLALALGYAHLYSIRNAPQFNTPVLDEMAYHTQALRILDGAWPGGEVFYQDPLYPYFLAATYSIAGERVEVVKYIQVLLGAAVVLLIFGVGKQAFTPGVGAVAAFLAALYLPLYFFEGVLTKEILGLFFMGVSLWGLLWAADEMKWSKAALSGFFLGLACLTRANLLLMIPAWAIWLGVKIYRSEEKKKGLATAAILVAFAGLAISPATIHNIRAGDFVLITSQGGQNFYIGNHPDNNSGTYKSPSFVRANPLYEQADFRKVAERAAMRELKPSEVSDYWYRRSWEVVRNAPAGFLKKLWRKMRLVVNNFEISDNLNYYYFRDRYSPVLRLPGPGWGVFSALGIFGALLIVFRWVRRRDSETGESAPLILLAFIYSGTLIVFYVFSRYRLPLLVAFAPLAVFGLKSMALYLGERRIWAFTGCAAVAGLLLVWTYSHIMEPHYHVAYYQTGNIYARRGEWKKAEREYTEALLRAPGKAAYHVNMAGVLFEQGRYGEAEKHYSEAIALNSEYVKAHVGLGNLYMRTGRYADAVNQYQLAILYGGDTSLLWTRTGNAYLKAGKYQQARNCFVKALQLDRSNDKAMDLLKKTIEVEEEE